MDAKRDIDEIIGNVTQKFPTVKVWQLEVKFPADDDGIWYFWLPENSDDDLQIENSWGQCPFIIETKRNAQVRQGNTVEEVINVICEHLKTSLEINNE